MGTLYSQILQSESESNESKNQYNSILVKKYHMVVYYTTGPKKNSMVERFNRTIKERIERFFTESNTKNWVDILDDFFCHCLDMRRQGREA